MESSSIGRVVKAEERTLVLVGVAAMPGLIDVCNEDNVTILSVNDDEESGGVLVIPEDVDGGKDVL